MNVRVHMKAFVLAVLLCACFPLVEHARQIPEQSPAPKRQVALTFDDLPLQGPALSNSKLNVMTAKLLKSLTTNKVPALGVVNGHKLYSNKRLDPARVAMLRMWLDAGFELGNHTYSHADINTMPLASYQQDVIRGETTIRDLLREKGMPLRYFRHPVLHTGRTDQTRNALQQFLNSRGYTVAPVTIDNQDYVFADIYARAKRRGDAVTMRRVASEYIQYMERMFVFFEEQSRMLLGYELKQVLLLHANELNADHMDSLIAMIRSRGYDFITVEEALSDKAYELPERSTAKGMSWLFRWAAAKGVQLKPEPREPQWILELSREKVSAEY